ncbi:hypothetical protein K7432_012602 [Basidiobolus ranarum]|uniref:Derlin n=1 Tax=Basidiobolus ranarum TaxID=34480 RepID=A0ABR2VS01_9FUNG
MAIPLETWYLDIPVVTRVYLTVSVLLTLAVQLGLLTWFQLYYSFELIWYNGQYWRLITTFLYFGQFSLDWMFHMFFIGRYSRMLEEGSFYGRPGDFLWLLLLTGVSLLLIAPFVSMPFLGSPLNYTLVYIWSRRNPFIRLNFLGLFVFSAPYLPLVLLGFSMLLSSKLPIGSIIGIFFGHLYYFFVDVWPNEPASGGMRLLDTPQFIQRWFHVPINENIDVEIPAALNDDIEDADLNENEEIEHTNNPETVGHPHEE